MGKDITCVEDLESRLREQDCFIFADSYNTDLKKELLARRFSFYTVYDKNEDERYVVAWYEGKHIEKYREATEILGVKMEPVDPSVKTFRQLCEKHFNFLHGPYRLSDKKNLPHRLYGLGFFEKWLVLSKEKKLGHKLYF